MHQIKKIVEEFKGIEKRKSDLIDKPGYFSELTNAQMRPSGAISKRKGFTTLAEDKGALGIASYRGKTESELLVMDQNLTCMANTDVVFSTTVNDTLYISLLADATGNLIFYVNNGFTTETINLGDGYSTTTTQADLTIAQFVTQLAALPATHAVSINITNSNPAAFIEPFGSQVIQGGANPKTFTSTCFVPTLATRGDVSYNSFDGLWSRHQASNQIEPITTAIINNVMYFGTGYDEIMKYDGSKIYRAGLPRPTVPVLAQETTIVNPQNTSGQTIGLEHNHSSSVDEAYHYIAVYKHTDNQGNLITSTQSVDAQVQWNSHNHFVKITVPMLQAGTGFDLDNVKICIYRTPKETTDALAPAASYYLVTDGSQPDTLDAGSIPAGTYVNLSGADINNNEITNDKSVASVVFLDYLDDSKINNNTFLTTADYAEGRHDLPPRGKYVTAHQGCLMIAGNVTNPTEVSFSLPGFNLVTGEIGTEYFPNNSNSVIVDGAVGGPITAIKSLKDNLIVFHENTVSYLSGDVTTPGVQVLRKDTLSKQGEIGALAMASLQEYESALAFMSDEGIQMINSSIAYPEELSKPIKPLLLDRTLNKSKSVSAFDADKDIMLFNILRTGSDTVTYVFDVKHMAWMEWTNIDMQGGVVRHEKATYFVSKDKSMLRVQKIKNRGDESDYSDHNEAIEFKAITAWDSLTEPTVFKKFLRLKTFITDTNTVFEGSSFKLDLYLRKNFSTFDYGPISLESGSLGGWGTGAWGQTFFGDVGQEGIRTKMFGKAKSMALHFENKTINENILISGFAYEIAAPFKPEIKE